MGDRLETRTTHVPTLALHHFPSALCALIALCKIRTLKKRNDCTQVLCHQSEGIHFDFDISVALSVIKILSLRGWSLSSG